MSNDAKAFSTRTILYPPERENNDEMGGVLQQNAFERNKILATAMLNSMANRKEFIPFEKELGNIRAFWLNPNEENARECHKVAHCVSRISNPLSNVIGSLGYHVRHSFSGLMNNYLHRKNYSWENDFYHAMNRFRDSLYYAKKADKQFSKLVDSAMVRAIDLIESKGVDLCPDEVELINNFIKRMKNYPT